MGKQVKKQASSAKKPSKIQNKKSTQKTISHQKSKSNTSKRASDSDFSSYQNLTYHSGFGNHVESEAIKGACPAGQNNPQKAPLGLYTEQLSGTPFTFAKHKNQRTWLYRIAPTVKHEKWVDISKDKRFSSWISNFEGDAGLNVTPEQLRWPPIPNKEGSGFFYESVRSMMGAGGPQMKNGLSISRFAFSKSMQEAKTALYSADADLLIVPQQGVMLVQTEMGKLRIASKEIIVIPRGIKFAISSESNALCRGWMAELFKGHFQIPDLGPIGANGLANERDFQAPSAAYDDSKNKENWTVIARYMGKTFRYAQDHSPFDVVGWHGNYYPYRYDLNNFCTIGSISFDHPDPSIFTVLTAQTDDPGQAVLDFVIFPPRWLVAENTFRPPYYHRNTMTEFMGNIAGTYDAKEKGFIPGASSLHSCMSGHGPEAEVFDKASNADLKPMFVGKDSLAFMFETCYMLKLTDYAMKADRDTEYRDCWKALPKQFKN